uniref:Uncharacterized protein n=1 Tax=Arion vulgaris TaxID=1028688 RepID=A0A0B6YIH1_9EUPU
MNVQIVIKRLKRGKNLLLVANASVLGIVVWFARKKHGRKATKQSVWLGIHRSDPYGTKFDLDNQ